MFSSQIVSWPSLRCELDQNFVEPKKSLGCGDFLALLLNPTQRVKFKNSQLYFLPSMDFKLNHMRVTST